MLALNGLANMSVTTASGTPFQWATIAGLYGKYRVDRCRFTAKFFDPSVDGVTVGAQLRGVTVGGANLATVSQRPGNVVANLANTGDQSFTLRGDCDCAKSFGQTKEIYRANYGAVVASNPGASSNDFTLLLRCFALCPYAGVTGNVSCIVELEYDTDLFDVQI